MITSNPLRHAAHALPLAALSLLLLTAGMCRQAGDPAPADDPAATAAGESEQAKADERDALAAALARAADEAREQERQTEIEAAERQLAEREARLAEEEASLAAEQERLRRERELAAEQERLAAERAAAAERERKLAAREQELREQEAQLARREEELTREQTPIVEPAAPEPLPEPTGTYEGDFDEPWRESQETADAETAPAPAEPGPGAAEIAPPPTFTASLEPGARLEVQIVTTLTSATARVGEVVSTRLVEDVYDAHGTLVIPAGAEVVGRVTEAEPYRRRGGPATLGVEFTEIIVPPDQRVGIRASFVELGADKRKNRKKVIAGAVVGAILGHVLGGDGSKNVVIGAAAGAAASGAMVASAKGRDAEIPAGQIVALQLDEVVTVEIEYGAVR